MLVKKIWNHSQVVNTNMPTIDTESDYQPGGVSIIVTNRWASQIVESGTDEMGRWVYVTLQGQHNTTLTCMGLYRVNKGSISTSDEQSA